MHSDSCGPRVLEDNSQVFFEICQGTKKNTRAIVNLAVGGTVCRAIEFLSVNSLNINTLVTDRHNQISKFVCKKHPSIEHRYDVWHVSKGMLA